MARYVLDQTCLSDPHAFLFRRRYEIKLEYNPPLDRRPRWKRVPLDMLPEDLKAMAFWLRDKNRRGRFALFSRNSFSLSAGGTAATYRVCRVVDPIFYIEGADTAFEFKMRWWGR